MEHQNKETYIDSNSPVSIGVAIGNHGLDLDTEVESNCRICETPIGSVVKAYAHSLCCDKCVEKAEYDRKIESMKKFWNKFCPKLYRDTDLKHEDFSRIWTVVAGYKEYTQNLVFCGASGSCKTRAMMHRLKLAFLNGKSIDVLWADHLDKALDRDYRELNVSKLRDRFETPDIVGIDDFLTSGSSLEGCTKFLKGLIDARLREGKTTILTTNLLARDIEADSEKFGNATKADQQRVQAIIRRIRGEYKTVDFDAGNFDGKF